MAGLQELRKRLRSIRSTGQLAGAMRTAATAKYARLGRIRSDYIPYARACREMLDLLGTGAIDRETETAAPRDCLVIMSSNRGLCGGFNAELFRFLEEELAGRNAPLLISCGRKASSWLRERGLPFEERILSDVPDHREARELSRRLREIYVRGEAERVFVIHQHFHNMLTQTPAADRILPQEAPAAPADDRSMLLFLPDRETIGAQLAISCLDARVYDLALDSAAGAQAATLMAMRSACDNAAASAADLEITINRRRQAEVTASVIETASGNIQQGD